MAPFAVGSGCSIMLSEHGLDVFDVPRSIFDELPGFECERADAGNGQRFYVRHGTVSDTLQVTFYCNQPPSPVRSDTDRVDALAFAFGIGERTG